MAGVGGVGEKQPLALRTIAGPVDLRPKRKPRTVALPENKGAKAIKKDWLKEFKGDETYQKAVKQSMLVAAEEIKLLDAGDKSFTSSAAPSDTPQIQAKIQSLLQGKVPVSVFGHKKKQLQQVVRNRHERQRDTLIKISKKRPCFAKVERTFIIDNGELLVYRDHHPNAKVKAYYQLKNASCFYETPDTSSLPRWQEGYKERLRVICQEREAEGKSPLFLYSQDSAKIHRWKRAFTLAKVLVSENDRRALKIAIGRATSGALMKAWGALSTYYQEYARTKALVKNMAMRLMQVDMSRGWMKFKLVHKKKVEERARRKEQQVWAARFMSEKLTKLGQQNAKQLADVREGVITRIQTRFRSYREDMIFDRTYPLGPNMMSKVQEAKTGKVFDFAMRTATSEEACRLSLLGNALTKFLEDKDTFKTVMPSYSVLHEPLPVSKGMVYASDNLQCLSFAQQTDAADAFAQLGKADWSKFINFDRISSVILHSEPMLGAKLAAGKQQDAGVWCTICGPRVAWDRRVVDVLDDKKQPIPTVFGAEDGIQVATQIAKGLAIKWVKLKATLKGCSLPGLQQPVRRDDVEADAEQDEPDLTIRTVAVLHLLGWSFQSEIKEGRSPEYSLQCDAAVPVSGDTFTCLDSSDVGIEIYQLLPEGKKLLLVGSETLATLFGATVNEDGSRPSLNAIMTTSRVADYPFNLLHPSASPPSAADDKNQTDRRAESNRPKTTIGFDLNAQLTDASPTSPVIKDSAQALCISPELMGGGSNSTLFSSNRMVWYDPDLGAGKFRPDHVANFLELSLGSLRFPSGDAPDDANSMYYVRARICGVSVNSVVLHRPKREWSKVLADYLCDPSTIRFEGHKLLLPLPPGCWGSDPLAEERRKVYIQVWRRQSQDITPVSYQTFTTSGTSPGQKEVLVYHASIKFDKKMLVDWPKAVSTFLTKQNKPVLEVDAHASIAADDLAERDTGLLNLEFCLRDRDQARATQGSPGNRSALCVGDKAMIVVEEPFLYPVNGTDFRRQFCIGDFEPKKNKVGAEYAGPLGLPLRQPCLSSEYAESGLGELVPKRPFKQSFIPQFCDDVIPHQYVLPVTEKEFLDKHLPGYYGRVMDSLAKNGSKDSSLPFRAGPNKPVVTHLTHMNKQVQVTVVATYADNTCDVELHPTFLEKWKKEPHRKYAMPGAVDKKVNGDKLRVILRKVPMALMSAVHYSGINLYDAAFKSTSDVLAAPAPENDFNPRSEEASKPGASKEHSKFVIAAGPLPADASPHACNYEFQVRMRFPSDFEMYEFVALLRRCARLDQFGQAQRMLEYQKKQNMSSPLQPHQHGHRRGGQLDVVLVEARRLKPLQSAVNTVLQSDPLALYEQWSKGKIQADPAQSNQMLDSSYLPTLMGTTGGETVKTTPEGSAISTFVNFRMLHNKETVAYRGQKVQMSPIIDGTDSPVWSAKEELAAAGGWTFRTGNIDPEKYPKLLIEFEVMQAAIPKAQRIGVIQLPVTEEQFLTNPDKLFKNLWLPLVDVKDGVLTPNVTGEIHILTRWLPAEMKQVLADGSEKLQLSVRSMFMKEIWPKVIAPRIREPIYGIEAVYAKNMYNPNLVRPKEGEKDKGGRFPEMLKENIRRHVEELYNTVPYIECLERRQMNAWKNFKEELAEKAGEGASIGELRLVWQEQENTEMMGKLQSLIMRGVPSTLRPEIWAQVTLATRIAAQGVSGHGDDAGSAVDTERAAEQEYQTLLQRGLPQVSDAGLQLQEDAVIMTGWESSVPPLPEAVEFHLRRIRKAKNVVTALLACQDSGITYCESLLVIAFFLLLPQGYKASDSPGGVHEALTTPKESDVFWLMYSLIAHRINGSFREYYGVPFQPTSESLPPMASLTAGSGASQDVWLLECCLAYHEKDLWTRMTAMGFQLMTIFYGAFMKWFATYMPTASVFRLWDALLFQSTNPKANPSPRAYLINLAFAALRSKRPELMVCQSAAEMRSLILGFFASLYDGSTVIDMVMAADAFLWGGGGFSSGKVGHLFTLREDVFKGVNHIAKSQNEILKQLMHVASLKTRSSKPEDAGKAGVTTAQLVRDIIPLLQVNIDSMRQRGAPRFYGMHRPMPLASRVISETAVDKAWSFFQTNILAPPKLPIIPFMISPPGDARVPGMEPLDIIASDLVTVMERELKGWGPHATALWNVFSNRPRNFIGNVHAPNQGGFFGSNLLGVSSNDPSTNYGNTAVISGEEGQGFHTGINPNDGSRFDPLLPPQQTQFQRVLGNVSSSLFGIKPVDPDPNMPKHSRREEGEFDERISLNELYTGLICASRGTVSEKAAALFNIYSYSDPRGKDLEHVVPINRLAVTTSAHAVETAAEVSRVLAPPNPESEDAKNNVLRFTVMTNYPHKNTTLGDVFIQSLTPYIAHGEATFRNYNIWGRMPESLSAKRSNQQGNRQPNVDKLVCVGELNMAIKWIPKSIVKPEIGQLTVHVRHINFHSFYISDFFSINPWIKVYMCNVETTQAGALRKWVDVPRWDPRSSGLAGKRDNVSFLAQGPYGGIIVFDPTLRTKTFGGNNNFGSWIRHGQEQGFNKETEAWEWNETWGKQNSKELMVLPEFVQLSSRRNVMDMQGVRMLVTYVLQRCQMNMTNRQCICTADTLFNRAGNVPGIYQAIITFGTNQFAPETSLNEIIQKLTEAKRSFVDVTPALLMEHERQIAHNGGLLNLFTPSYYQLPVNLKTMNMSDPFPNQQKTLYVRYVRSGDGERVTQGIHIQPNGDVPNTADSEVFIDGHYGEESWPMRKVTKEEFIGCITDSALLGESIRRLGHLDPVIEPAKPISLEVSIMDPHQEDAFQDLEDAIQVQQSLLIEVWDQDMLGADFLGEAWLPPLSDFGPRSKDLVLPLVPANFSEDADNGATRPDEKKKLKDDGKDPNMKVTGDIWLSVSWVYPVQEARALDKDIGEWLKELETKHKFAANTLTKHAGNMIQLFGSLKQIQQTNVKVDGSMEKGFFEVLNITEEGHKKAISQWFKERAAEDMKARAKQQELEHTGKLTIQIKKAEKLRRADAKKLRNCDPKAFVYVRNDVRAAWRKKPLMQTNVVRDNRDPVWNHEETKMLFSGAFEAKMKPPAEGWGAEAGRLLSGPRQTRERQEDRSLAAVKRFGQNGLKVRFLDSAESKSGGGAAASASSAASSAGGAGGAEKPEGENHKVELFLTDTIRDFKEKLTLACQLEAKYWRESKGLTSEGFARYDNIEIGNRHLVMAYVPSAQVSKMRSAGLENTEEYQRQSKIASQDPSNWQPLDTERSFQQYVSMFGFGKQKQVLRIVEATEGYKAVNLRYKTWAAERLNVGLRDLNDARHCFGYAKYTHRADGNSVEWRPAFISKSATDPAANFRVKWVFDPPKELAPPTDEPEEDGVVELPRSSVLLAPRLARFDDQTHPLHKDILGQARLLRMSGKSDWEIEANLNKVLDTKWDELKRNNEAQDSSQKPPRITVDQIRLFLQRQEEKNAGKLFK